MNKELLETALAGLNALIVDAVSGTNPRRYERVMLFATQARQLAKLCAVRVAAQPTPEPGFIGGLAMGRYNGVLGADPGDAMVHACTNDDVVDGDNENVTRLHGGGLESHDVIDTLREMMPPPEDGAVKQLDRLLDVREKLATIHHDTSAIDAKINAELHKMQGATHADPRALHPELLRRREAGEDQRVLVQGDHRAGDRAREAGAGQAARGGIEEGVVDVPSGVAVRHEYPEGGVAGADR